MRNDPKIFSGKSYSDLLGEIYKNANENRKIILANIAMLSSECKVPGDKAVFAPIIKENLLVLVNNDNIPIKLAQIIQRIISAENYSGGATELDFDEILSEDERRKIIEETQADLKLLNEKSDDVKNKTKNVLELVGEDE